MQSDNAEDIKHAKYFLAKAAYKEKLFPKAFDLMKEILSEEQNPLNYLSKKVKF